MNQKGLSLVELLIVIVVTGILASFSVVAVGNIIQNSKEDSFVNTARTMLTAASNAYNQNDDLWNDNIATMQELVDNEYLDVSTKDPWGEPYDMVNSHVIIDSILKVNSDNIFLNTSITVGTDSVLKVRLISTSATLGYDGELSEFDRSHVILLVNNSIINGIIENITGNANGAISGDNDNDSITVESNAGSNTDINTFNGNDIVTIGNDMLGNSQVNTGSGNDTVIINNDMKQNSSVDTGDGDDTIQLDRWLRGNSIVDGGAGNDIITITEIRLRTKTYGGAGNDTVIINSINSNFKGIVDMGDGDDVLTINDSTNPFNGVTGDFIGGAGNDILNLPYVNIALWNTISHLFSGFETINLSDGTITN